MFPPAQHHPFPCFDDAPGEREDQDLPDGYARYGEEKWLNPVFWVEEAVCCAGSRMLKLEEYGEVRKRVTYDRILVSRK